MLCFTDDEPDCRVTGKQLFSLLIRPNMESKRVINVEASNRNYFQKKVLSIRCGFAEAYGVSGQ